MSRSSSTYRSNVSFENLFFSTTELDVCAKFVPNVGRSLFLKPISHDAIFLETCNAALVLRDSLHLANVFFTCQIFCISKMPVNVVS